MGKKKKEHIVFDKMLSAKPSIPFAKVNSRPLRNGGNNPPFQKPQKG